MGVLGVWEIKKMLDTFGKIVPQKLPKIIFGSFFQKPLYKIMYQSGIAYVTANPSTAGLYSAEQYNKARQDGYNEGYAVGYEAGGNGQTTVIERPSIQMDVQGLVFSIPALFNQIIQGAFGFTIFGINIAGALLTIIVIVAFIWLIKKFK